MSATDIVQSASLVQLVDALNDDILGRFTDLDGLEFFRCPKCGDHDDKANSGRAVIVSADRWNCTACRWFGTRWQLERLVLEDAIVLDRLVFAVEVQRG